MNLSCKVDTFKSPAMAHKAPKKQMSGRLPRIIGPVLIFTLFPYLFYRVFWIKNPTGEGPRTEFYNEDYLTWQKPMNIFGARVKGDLLHTFLGNDIKSVLEFGCSAGYILAGLRGSISKKNCVEINDDARKYATREHKELNVFKNVNSAKKNGVVADFIYSTSVLEHVECPLCELRNLKNVLHHTKGILLIGIRNDGTDLKQTFSNFNNDPNNHLYTWNELLLANLIRAAGFHVCNTRGQYEAWVPPLEIAAYEADRLLFCRRGLSQGLRTSTFYIWSISVLPGNEQLCDILSPLLDQTQNCSYLLPKEYGVHA